MADKKISALDAASTPLAGTEVVALVQSGTTKKVPVSDLTAGRAISATQLTLTTGNLIVANGQGIDFSDTPGTGTSELLDDYEEGTWTATLIGTTTAPTTPVTVTGKYTKIGDQVTVSCTFNNVDTTGAAGDMRLNGLPFASGSYGSPGTAGKLGLGANVSISYVPAGGFTIVQFFNATTLGVDAIVAGTSKFFYVSVTYFV
jgi:hypothetical protein